ncbi:DUF2180 family protein [Streptomyces sp. NPDC089424]|uniref:DUF2180 family protein n=1 Tax=Streptomyces sp. NPDC089424 TaxID=3365917 RepID=UPI0038179247
MNCYDCAADALRPVQSPAVAVCARCGAGMCSGHLHATRVPVPGAAGVSAQAPDARRLTCGICYEAEQAVAGVA